MNTSRTIFMTLLVLATTSIVAHAEQSFLLTPVLPLPHCPTSEHQPVGTSPQRESLAIQIKMSSGCCTYNGGICGCSDGRLICCDGTYDYNCSCNHPDTKRPYSIFRSDG